MPPDSYSSALNPQVLGLLGRDRQSFRGYLGRELVRIVPVYLLLTLLSVYFLGSSAGLILGVGVVLVSFALRMEVLLWLFLISCMIDIPLVHLPPTESLTLRVHDLLLLALFARIVAGRVISRTENGSGFDWNPVPVRYRRLLLLLLGTIFLSAVIGLAGGVGGMGAGVYEVDKSHLAFLIWNAGRSLASVWVFFIFARLCRNPSVRMQFLWATYAIIFVACCYVVLEFLTIVPSLWKLLPFPWYTDSMVEWGRSDMVGSFNRNHTQIGLVTLLGFILGFGILYAQKKSRLLIVLMQAVLLMAMLVSLKRAAYIAACVAVVAFLFLQRKLSLQRKNLGFLLVGGAVLLLLVWTTGVWGILQERLLVPEGVVTRETGLTRGRAELWMQGVEYIKAHPEILLTGRGLTYEENVGLRVEGRRTSSHNEWLNLIIERGVLGFLAVLLTVLVFFIDAVAGRRRKNKFLPGSYYAAYAALIMGAAVFSMASRTFSVNDPVGSFPALFFAVSALILVGGRPRRFLLQRQQSMGQDSK